MTRFYILAAVFFYSVISAQTNNYIWFHGLNDNSDCWSLYDTSLTPTNSRRINYQSNTSIQNISQGIWSSYNGSFPQNSILIGHSMGGLVARELEFRYPNSVKGIITIGTPNQGAQVVSELFNGSANNLAKKVVEKGKRSVQASLTAIKWSVPGVSVLLSTVNVGIDVLYKYVGVPYIDKTINSEIAVQVGSDCAKDMIPNSNFMKKIGSRKANVPILSFACQEDRWQLARVGYCSSNKNKLQTDATINNNGDYDMGGYNQLHSLNKTFKTVGGIHAGAAVAFGVGGFFNPFFWGAAAANGVASKTWYSTAGYVDDGLDFDHAVLLGSSRVDRIETLHRFLWVKWTSVKYITVPLPHDGVVGIDSQQMDKSKGNNVIWANTTIKGVNHMEEFNHKNTREEFSRVLNGESYAPLTFRKN
jgi:pimeloyl-ACP methyl ester carboxylesterase